MSFLNYAPERVDALAWYPYHPDNHKELQVRSKYDSEVIDLGVKKYGMLGVPRALPKAEGLVDKRVTGHYVDLQCKLPPRNAEQQRVVMEAGQLLLAGDSFIIQATTGFGKTYCASWLISLIKTTTLVIVTKEDLMDQWRKELKKFLGLTDADIGIAQADTCNYKGKKIVLGMVHSLAKDKYGSDFKNYFGMVVYDEVHRMGAETFSQTAGMFPAKLRLGLSATVERPDGKTPIFTSHIGPVRIKTALQQLPLKALIRKTGHRIKVKHEPARMMGAYKAMAADFTRNGIIIDFVRQAYDKGRTIIVFSHLREAHLNVLMQMAVEAGIPKKDMTFYVGGMTSEQRKAAMAKRVWFATYKMTAEATDNPKLDTAVFATPQANITQSVGRILREYPGKKEPVVLDLLDSGSPIASAFLSKRRQQYYQLGAKVLEI